MEFSVDPKSKPRPMSDLGPRRSMDMRRHTAAPVAARTEAPERPAHKPAARPAHRPLGQAVARPEPRPAARPIERPEPRPEPRQSAPTSRPVARVEAPAPLEIDTRELSAPAAPRTSAWKIVLQFIVGLLVIAGVATAIVALYVKYYQ